MNKGKLAILIADKKKPWDDDDMEPEQEGSERSELGQRLEELERRVARLEGEGEEEPVEDIQ